MQYYVRAENTRHVTSRSRVNFDARLGYMLPINRVVPLHNNQTRHTCAALDPKRAMRDRSKSFMVVFCCERVMTSTIHQPSASKAQSQDPKDPRPRTLNVECHDIHHNDYASNRTIYYVAISNPHAKVHLAKKHLKYAVMIGFCIDFVIRKSIRSPKYWQYT